MSPVMVLHAGKMMEVSVRFSGMKERPECTLVIFKFCPSLYTLVH